MKRREALLVALLVLATAAVFAPLARHEFLSLDDAAYVVENPHVQAGLSWRGIVWAFSSWEQAHFWHPLTWLSHLADVELFGIDGLVLGLPASGWHHLTSLAFHVANTVLLFLFLHTATRAAWPSAFVAALFALHPLHVESVAWVAERKDVLSTFFGFACLLAYVRYARGPSLARYTLVFALLALGLMAKPMLVTWPFVMLLLDLWPLGRWPWPLGRVSLEPSPLGGGSGAHRDSRIVLEKLPLLALSTAACIVAFLAQRSAMPLMDVVPPGTRVQHALVSYAAYVGKTFWPTDLAVLYPYRRAVSVGSATGAAVLLAVVTIGVAVFRRRRPYLAVGWFWFLGTLVPVIGFVQVGLHSMADRYTYIPLVGLFVMLVWTAADLGRESPRVLRTSAAAAVVVCVACAVASARQVRLWADSVTLFRHTCDVTKDNGWAHRILGAALARAGRTREAIAEYHEALRAWPDDPIARHDLGFALAAEGRADEAFAEYRAAVRLDPRNALYRAHVGGALARAGRTDEAIGEFRAALSLDPDLVVAHNNLGQALAFAGREAEAVGAFRAALRVEPENVAVLNNLAGLLAARGNGQEAVELAERAVALTRRRDPACLDTLASAYAVAGRLDAAVGTADEALRVANTAGSRALAEQIAQHLAEHRRQLALRADQGSGEHGQREK